MTNGTKLEKMKKNQSSIAQILGSCILFSLVLFSCKQKTPTSFCNPVNLSYRFQLDNPS